MGFSELHPAVRHHVVNSLGWKELRDLQERSISPVLAGDDLLIVGPTAGGKTEAAALPLLSRMTSEEWSGLSLLYISPLRALANNIEQRLSALFRLLGREAGAWHGDVGQSRRKAILREPPDVLVTTPESIEVMLVSTKVDARRFFSQLQAVVIDEVHSFGSDDRGWHLLAVLSRIERLVGRRLQRVALSATVGNPEELLEWVAMPESSYARAAATVVRSSAKARRDVELRADYVGSLNNAARVIAGLHRGEKRLVFCDSRADVERLAAAIREESIDTFVSHSSLSRDERRQAESAFAAGNNCVIVATSTLELGIDVGDLDRVIQIDAPTSVASFLQRMGRTGRRPGTSPNMLFLASKPEHLLRALALGLLWGRGFVEHVSAPPRPDHIVAQQLLALCLQEGRVGQSTWFDEIRSSGLAEQSDAEQIASHMLDIGMLAEDGGMLFLGEEAETAFGRRHFMELLSVFTTPPLIEVRHGRDHLGSVHESSFYSKEGRQPVLLLGGRSWTLEEVDWKRRLAFVVPAPDRGDSKWIGAGQPLSFELCRAMRDVLVGARPPVQLSERAEHAMSRLRAEFPWVSSEHTTLASDGSLARWWTFAGTLANEEIQRRLDALGDVSGGPDELSIAVPPRTAAEDVRRSVLAPPVRLRTLDPETLDGLKFRVCLTAERAARVLFARSLDENGVRACATEPIHADHRNV